MEYQWYEVQNNSAEITQGDIIKECPVPILKDYDILKPGQDIHAEISIIDGIVLTQACDIANKKVENIILCAITSKADFEKIQHNEGKSPIAPADIGAAYLKAIYQILKRNDGMPYMLFHIGYDNSLRPSLYT